MRIAHVTDCYLPRLGGIEMQVHDLASRQLAAGHEVRILTCTPEGSGGELSAGPGRLEPGPVPVLRLGKSVGVLPSVPALVRLRQEIRSGAFDVVHAHSSVVSPFAWSAARSAARAGLPAVLTMHSVVSSRRVLRELCAGLAGRRGSVSWTAVSEMAAARLRPALNCRVDVLANGIDPQAWLSSTPREPGAVLTIVSVMRLTSRKRPMAFLRMLEAVRAQIPASVPLRAVVIGDGPLEPQMTRFLRARGMQSWVTLTGRLSREEIRPLLAAADVYLAPAELESFGIAALEARCAGLPVVAMAGGGVGEFIRDGQEGFLVHSDAEMGQATARLLMSPQLRLIQEHNRCTTPDLAWPRVVELSLEFYRGAGVMAAQQLATSRFAPV